MTAHIIPNSFQTPNIYVDTALELLTPEEWKCLSFAIRHILGWQDKINKRRGVISLSMFEHGFTAKDGQHFGGTGLTRGAVLKAVDELARFELLIPLDVTEDGQEYELGQTPRWTLLLEREAARKAAARQRTEKATAVRQQKRASTSDVPMTGGSSDVPLSVRATYQQQYVGRTDSGSSDVLNQTHLQTHSQSHDKGAPDGASLPSEKKARKPHKNAPWHDALVAAFGHEPGTVTVTLDRLYWKVAAELAAVQFPADSVAGLHQYVKAKAQRERWNSFSAAVLAKYAPDYLKLIPAAATPADTPDTGPRPRKLSEVHP